MTSFQTREYLHAIHMEHDSERIDRLNAAVSAEVLAVLQRTIEESQKSKALITENQTMLLEVREFFQAELCEKDEIIRQWVQVNEQQQLEINELHKKLRENS